MRPRQNQMKCVSCRHRTVSGRRLAVLASRMVVLADLTDTQAVVSTVGEIVIIQRGELMQYRTIGKTGLRVSEIGFGCGNNAVLMVKAPYEDQVKAVRHALDRRYQFLRYGVRLRLGKV